MTRSWLTPRESEVLTRVSFGWSNTEIGDDLAISPDTVKTHVQNVLNGLGAHNRAHAVGIALRTGLLGVEVTPARRHRDQPTEAVLRTRARLDAFADGPDHGSDHYDLDRESQDASEPTYA